MSYQYFDEAKKAWGRGTCLGTSNCPDNHGICAVWQYEWEAGSGQKYRVNRHFCVKPDDRWETSVDLEDASAVQVITYLLDDLD